MFELFDDDITFCMSECDEVGCFRHPSNIKHPEYPQSFAYFIGTDTCPLEQKDDNEVWDDYPCNTCITRDGCDMWEAQFCCTLCRWMSGDNEWDDYMCEHCDPMDI